MPRIRDLGISVIPVMPVPYMGFDLATEPQYLSCVETTCEEGSDSVMHPCDNDESCSQDTAQCEPHSTEEVRHASALHAGVVAQLKQHLRERLAAPSPN
jgi:hypothetical protein